MSEPGAQQPADDEHHDTGLTSDPSRGGGGRTQGDTNVDDDLGRGDPSAG